MRINWTIDEQMTRECSHSTTVCANARRIRTVLSVVRRHGGTGAMRTLRDGDIIVEIEVRGRSLGVGH